MACESRECFGSCLPKMSQKTKSQLSIKSPIIYQIMVSTIITIHYKESFSHNEVNPHDGTIKIQNQWLETSRQKIKPEKHKIYFLTLYLNILLFNKTIKYTKYYTNQSVFWPVTPYLQRDLPQAKFEMNMVEERGIRKEE